MGQAQTPNPVFKALIQFRTIIYSVRFPGHPGASFSSDDAQNFIKAMIDITMYVYSTHVYSVMNAKMMQLEKSACNYNNFDSCHLLSTLATRWNSRRENLYKSIDYNKLDTR